MLELSTDDVVDYQYSLEKWYPVPLIGAPSGIKAQLSSSDRTTLAQGGSEKKSYREEHKQQRSTNER